MPPSNPNPNPNPNDDQLPHISPPPPQSPNPTSSPPSPPTLPPATLTNRPATSHLASPVPTREDSPPPPPSTTPTAGDISPGPASAPAPAPDTTTSTSTTSTTAATAADMNVEDSNTPLTPFDWEDLHARFRARMEGVARAEGEAEGEFGEWVSVFKTWAQSGQVHEAERAGKRLRTQSAFVQLKEAQLEEKRLHYMKVVQAFESALALLGGS